jgi:hypothetical protein
MEHFPFSRFVIAAGLDGKLKPVVICRISPGWALLIHFVLDIVIFGAGAMIIAGKPTLFFS